MSDWIVTAIGAVFMLGGIAHEIARWNKMDNFELFSVRAATALGTVLCAVGLL